MSFYEEREKEDTASKMSSPSPESNYDQLIKNLPSVISDETVTSDPRYETSYFSIWQKCLFSDLQCILGACGWVREQWLAVPSQRGTKSVFQTVI